VVVHASMQGPSHATLLDTLSKGPELGLKLRGVAGISDPDVVEDAELDALHSAGVRGTRLLVLPLVQDEAVLASKAQELGSVITRLAGRFARLGWVIVLACPLTTLAAIADVLRGLDPRVKVAADHCAHAYPGDEETDDFRTVLDLLKEGKLFVKLSALERSYGGYGGDIDSLAPIAKAYVEANPDQILYGTDWPFCARGKPVNDVHEPSEFEDFREVPSEEHIRKLREWIPDEETWHKLFVTNPERLFS